MLQTVTGCYSPQRAITASGEMKPIEDHRPWNFDKKTAVTTAFRLLSNSSYPNRELFDAILGLKNIDPEIHAVCFPLACNRFLTKVTNYFTSYFHVTVTRSSVYQILFLFISSHEYHHAFLPNGSLHEENLNIWLKHISPQLINAAKPYLKECFVDHFNEERTLAYVTFEHLPNMPVYLSTLTPRFPVRVILNILELSDPDDIQTLQTQITTVGDWLILHESKLSYENRQEINLLLKSKEAELDEKSEQLSYCLEYKRQEYMNTKEQLQALQN
jgi:hypothetical protein